MNVLGRMVDLLDHRCFRRPDTVALTRGWTVARERLFTRTYRDPRFDELRQQSDRLVGDRCPAVKR